METEREKQSSVEVNRTSTGKFNWKVKLYFDEQDERAKEETLKKIDQINKELQEKYGD